jgi:hypothetical protein
MLDARGLGGACSVRGLGDLVLGRLVGPVVGHQVDAVHGFESRAQRGLVVQVRHHHLGTGIGEFLRLRRTGIAGQGTHGEFTVRFGENRMGQAAALCPGGTDHGDDLLLGHRHSSGRVGHRALTLAQPRDLALVRPRPGRGCR